MTAQVHERLILDGEPTTMACTPPMNSQHPRLHCFTREEQLDAMKKSLAQAEEGRQAGRRPFPGIDYINSTACWRRYIGTWEIKDGRLFLNAVEGNQYKILGDEPLFADWVIGVLRVPQGKFHRYVHAGFASRYETELFIKIRKGEVVDRLVIDNREASGGDLRRNNLYGHECFFEEEFPEDFWW